MGFSKLITSESHFEQCSSTRSTTFWKSLTISPSYVTSWTGSENTGRKARKSERSAARKKAVVVADAVAAANAVAVVAAVAPKAVAITAREKEVQFEVAVAAVVVVGLRRRLLQRLPSWWL